MAIDNPLQPRGGLLDMMGQGDSGFAGWLNPRRNSIINFGAGLIGADSARDAMRGAAQGAAQGRQQDTAYALLQQEQAEKQRALQEETQQRNATMEFLQRSHPDLAQAVQGGMGIGDAWSEAIARSRPATANPTTGMQNYEFLISQGVPASEAMQRAFSGGTTVNVGGDAPGLGKLSQDYGYVLDPATGQPEIDPATGLPRAAAVPGSPAWMELQAADDQALARESAAATSSDVVLNAASLASELAKRQGATGMTGALMANLSETEAAELRRQTQVLTSVATIENLNAMREQSPTGGALGNVTEGEGRMLAAAAGAIDPNSSPAQYQQQLDNYTRTLLRIIHGYEEGDRVFEQYRQQAGSGQRTTSTGVTWSM